MQVGQCVATCSDATLPGEPAWAFGPVWTKEEFESECVPRCSTSRACYRESCPGGGRYFECFTANRRALATAPSATCRSAYVAATCSEQDMFTLYQRMLTICLEDATSYDAEAHRRCISGL
jgi:hypothetical protein